MLHDNEFFSSLKKRLRFTTAMKLILIVLSTVVFPICEGILINLWTNSLNQQETAKVSAKDQADNSSNTKDGNLATTWRAILVAVGGFHLIFSGMLFYSDFPSLEIKLAKAAEVQENANLVQSEIQRRSDTYKMVRQSLSMLTQKTCDLSFQEEINESQQDSTQPEQWCQSGFEAGLLPIMQVVLDNITTTLTCPH